MIQNTTLFWVVLSLVSAFTASLIPIFAKIGIEKNNALFIASVRAFIMAFFLVFIFVGFGKLSHIKSLDVKTWIFITLSAVAGACSWLAYYYALEWGPASKVVAIDRLSLVFVLFFATFIGEPLTVKTILGALLMIGGAVLIAH